MQRGIIIRYVRLIALVSFQTRKGWTEPETAIIDTGVPISVIPRRIWQEARHGFYSNAETSISIAGRTVHGRLGEIKLRFHDTADADRISPAMTIKADLIDDDDDPILLGFEDMLTDVALHSNFRQQQAHLAFPHDE
jgi:hypothetical protein